MATNSESVKLQGSQDFLGNINLEGIHEGHSGDVLTTLENLKKGFDGWFKDQIDILAKTFVDFSDNYNDKQDEVIDAIQKIGTESYSNSSSGLSGIVDDSKGKKDNKNGAKANVSSQVKIEELNKLEANISLPFGVLFWKLDSIENKIGGKKQGDDNSGGVTNKIKQFLGGLAEGASGFMQLSIALFAFAGATAIFNFVDWGKAVVGMFAFATFIGGMTVIAVLMKGFIEPLKDMAKASLYLSGALLLFSVALLVASHLDKGITIFGKQILPPVDVKQALITIGLFFLFMAGVALVSRLAGQEQKNIAEFAKTTLMMIGSLLAFSFALAIMTLVGKGLSVLGIGIVDLEIAGLVIAGFIAFIGVYTGLAILANKFAPDIQEFVKSTILMTVSLVVFTFALFIVSNVMNGQEIKFGDFSIGSVSVEGAIIGVGSFVGFVTAFTALAILANKFAGDIMKFTQTTMLMSLSLIIFTFTIFIVSQMMNGQEIKFGNFSIGAFDIKGALIGLGFFFGFTIIFGALAILANSFVGQIAAMAVTVGLMSISLLLFGVAINVLANAVCGKDGDWKQIGVRSVAILAGLGLMVAFVAGYAALGAALTVIAPLVLVTSAILVPMALSLLLMGAVMGVIGKIMLGGRVKNEDGKEEDLKPYNPSLAPQFFKAFGDLIKDLTGSFNILELLKGVAKLALLDVASVMVLGLAHVLSEIGKVQQQMEKNPISPDVFQPFIIIIDQLIQVTKDLGIKGAVALVAAGQAMKDIAETINILFSVFDKATEYDFNGKDKEIFDKAIANMAVLSISFTEEVFIPTLNRFKGASTKAAKTAESFPLIVNAISGLVDIIQKVNKMDDLDMEKVKTVFSGLLEVMGIIVGKQAGWDKLGLAREKGLVDTLSDAAKKIQKANEVLGTEENPGPVLQFLKNVGAANTFMGKIVQNNFSIEPINNLVQVIEKIKDVKTPKILTELDKMANSNKFDKLAESLNKVADSLDKIKKNMPDTTSLSHLQELTGSKKKKVDTSATPSANNNSANETLEEIRGMLEAWNYDTDKRSGIYVSNLDDISVPFESARVDRPARVVKIANAW